MAPPSRVALSPEGPAAQQREILGQEMSVSNTPDGVAGTASSCQRAPPSVVATTALEVPSSPLTVSPTAKHLLTEGQLI